MDDPAGPSQKIFPFTGLQSRTMERISQSNSHWLDAGGFLLILALFAPQWGYLH